MNHMNNFYVELPSTDCHDRYPNNRGNNYRIQLSQAIHLPGKWEVALVEIMFDTFWGSFTAPHIYIYIDGKLKDDIKLPAKEYKTVAGVANTVMTVTEKYSVGLNINDDEHGNTTITLALNGTATGIAFSESLAKALGFETHKVYTLNGTTGAAKPATIKFKESGRLKVFSDVLSEQCVGSKMLKLLRTIPITTKDGETQHTEFSSRQYRSVYKQEISSIEMQLSTDAFEPIDFGDGKVDCQLHFVQVALE